MTDDRGNHNQDIDKNIDTILDKYERRQVDGRQGDDASGGMSTISRIAGKATATSVIATVDSRGVFQQNKEMELLVDLIARTHFKSAEERYYFLDWVEWCEDFGVGLSGPIMWASSARSEGGQSINQLITALTRVEYRTSYDSRGRIQEKQPGEHNQPL